MKVRCSGKVTFELEEYLVPITDPSRSADCVRWGEDYELLFAISERSSQRLIAEWPERFPGLKLTCVGALAAEGAEGAQGLSGGWDHFRERG